MVDAARTRLRRLNERMLPAPFALQELIAGAWLSQAIHAAAELGIADALSEGPLTAGEIAEKVGADPDATGRLLRLLSSRAIFTHRQDGRYDLSSMGAALRSDIPNSMRAFAQFVGHPAHREHWSLLAEAVRTGDMSLPALRGMDFWEYLDTNQGLADAFNGAMTSLSEATNAPVLAAYDFSGFGTIVDVGGGHGRFLAGILGQAAESRGILFDLASVADGASDLLRAEGVAGRCTIETGSFFDSVPAGGDAYVMRAIIHDWEESKALQILRNIHAAMKPTATLLLVELVLPDDDSPHPGKLIDLEMLANIGGRERTAAEYRELLERAGFRMTRVVPTASPASVVEARREHQSTR
ncbi:methyltransferase [Aeromicrobium sp.]|uniref:methyltransferase n=1 Tax=Aeromicrobium sp. TaxID=1871063 RepID=UPI003C5F0838